LFDGAVATRFTGDTKMGSKEISDLEFIKILMNEDAACPLCFRPFLPWDVRPKEEGGDGPLVLHDGQWCVEEKKGVFRPVIKEGEGYVIPKLLKCNHAVCVDCAALYMETGVVFIGDGVRCHYKKIDQTGATEPSVCHFVTPCKNANDLPNSAENMLIAKVLHDRGVLLGSKKNKAFDGEFYYYFKFCHHCQREAKMICTKCHLPACDDCWKEHHASEGHNGQTVEDYEKDVVKKPRCEVCGEPACKYCGICRKFLCRNRAKCYDPCMDPDHLLIEYDPNLRELRRSETTAIENSRKMFVNDVHDYLETDPFIWSAADLECLKRTVWYEEYKRCDGNDGRVRSDDDDTDDDNVSEDDDDEK